MSSLGASGMSIKHLNYMFALALPLFCIVPGRNIIKEDLNDALVK